ncbi:hypothetical protein [Caldimonas brevitalea]|uniref:hypothetical protein n=1 Tax=Caldimonas brevitalea TaxID=413882 RepID=UPI0012F8DF77|nr:hypothetical protein [Caldimonas brevitalea]
MEYLDLLHRQYYSAAANWARWRNWPMEAVKIGDQKRVLSEAMMREVWRNRLQDGPLIDDPQWALGLVVRPHRLALVGDVFRVTLWNGMMERFAVTGVSGKGARLRNFHVKLHRESQRGGSLAIHDLPDDLIGYRWDHPDVGRFVDALRARVSAVG